MQWIRSKLDLLKSTETYLRGDPFYPRSLAQNIRVQPDEIEHIIQHALLTGELVVVDKTTRTTTYKAPSPATRWLAAKWVNWLPPLTEDERFSLPYL